MSFPSKLLPVGHDLGNSSRRHVFVLGPEGSATRLWTRLVASALRLDASKLSNEAGGTNHIYNNQAALFHVSLPFGATCGLENRIKEEPVLLDFGGTWKAYERNETETSPIATAFDLKLYMVDPLKILQAHHERGDAVSMLMVVRDPRASLADKVMKHCKLPHVAREEQKKSFDLILKAAKSGDSKTVVICYEDMVAQGPSYIQSKLEALGIQLKSPPQLKDANAKYSLKSYDCQSDILAYAELCPKTPFAQEVKASCASHFATRDF